MSEINSNELNLTPINNEDIGTYDVYRNIVNSDDKITNIGKFLYREYKLIDTYSGDKQLDNDYC